MAIPVFSLSAEVLTDAPFEVIAARLREPDSFRCFRDLGAPFEVRESVEGVTLAWSRLRLGARESGQVRVTAHERGAHLTLEARHRGWASFASFGLLRWKTDQLLEHVVEEL
ncbi:MAG TPA: hypothetical protein VJ623_11345 [Holophagaceae bacterium]|nr:hypothetical protein [Holophagaceae bacterium]